MINKRQYNVNADHKVLHKIGKKWVTISTLMLGLIGGATVAGHVTANADTTTPNQTSTNAKATTPTASTQSANGVSVAPAGQQAPTSSTPKAITSQASNLHQGLMLNATPNARPASSASASSNDSNVSKTSVSSSASVQPKAQSNSAKNNVSNNDMNTFTISSNNRAFNYVEAGLGRKPIANNQSVSGSNDSGSTTIASSSSTSNGFNASAPSAKVSLNSAVQSSSNEKNTVSQANGVITDNDRKRTLGAMPAFGSIRMLKDTDNNIVTGTYRGLNYKYNKANNSVEFTSGTADSDLSGLMAQNMPGISTPFNLSDIKSIKFDDNINTSKVTNMSYMFYSINNTTLQSIDFGNHFDTSKVANMSYMFSGDWKLQSLNLSCFNTNNVTNMNSMFYGDGNLHSINLGSNFNTSNVNNMQNMFMGDGNLQSLNLGKHFDTQKVTNNMQNMFSGTNLSSITLSSLTHIESNAFSPHTLSSDNFNNILKITGVSNFASSDLIMDIRYAPNISDFEQSIPTDISASNLTSSDGVKLYTMCKQIKQATQAQFYKVVKTNQKTNPITRFTTAMPVSLTSAGVFLSTPNPLRIQASNVLNFYSKLDGTNDYQFVGSQTLQGKHYVGDKVSVTSPNGYHFDNGTDNETITLGDNRTRIDVEKNTNTDNKDNDIPVIANPESAIVHVVPANSNVNYTPTSSSISGQTNGSDNNMSSFVPQGYKPAPSDLVNSSEAYNPTTNPVKPYKFNSNQNQSDTIKLEQMQVHGKATIHLVYKQSNGKQTESDKTINLSDEPIGTSDVEFYPSDYEADYYDDNNQTWHVPMDLNTIKSKGKFNANDYSYTYNPSDTFTYNADTAPDLVINYVNANDPNDLIQSTTYKASDMENKYHVNWIYGNTVNFSATSDAKPNTLAILKAPAGYSLANEKDDKYNHFNYDNDLETITLTPATDGGNVIKGKGNRPIVLMSFGMVRPSTKPSTNTNTKPSKPASGSTTANNAKPASHTTTPTQPSGSATPSVTPAPSPQPNHNVQPKPNVVPSDNVQPNVVPSDNTAKIITPGQKVQPNVISGKNNQKPSKAENKTDNIKHDTHVDRNMNKGKATAEPITYGNTVTPTGVSASRSNDVSSVVPSQVNTAVPHVASVAKNGNRKLPQTGDSNKVASIASILMLLTGIGLAGVDMDRKHRLA